MKKNRMDYFVMILILLALFVLFEKTMFLWAVMGLIVVCILAFLLIQLDKNKVDVVSQVLLDEHKKPYLEISAVRKRKLICTNQLRMRYELTHTLFDKKEVKEIVLPLSKNTDSYQLKITDLYCGQVVLECKSCALLDVLCLFSVPVHHQKMNTALIYPDTLNVQLKMVKSDQGMVDLDGFVQNKKGHDLSEIFDIRKYEPGDDIRSIHWKLSQKIDDLVIREASNLSQYSILVIPDLALKDLEVSEMNTSVSLIIALCEELISNHVAFCIPLVSEAEFQLCEIRNLNEFHDTLNAMLSMKAMPEHGEIMKYMFLNHMDSLFSRFIVVGNGKFKSDFYQMDSKQNFSLMHVSSEVNKYYYNETQTYFDAYIPVHQNQDETYSLYF